LKAEPGVKYHPGPPRGANERGVYDVAAAADAWRRVEDFFARYLK
jgi:dienelactone hydrolase